MLLLLSFAACDRADSPAEAPAGETVSGLFDATAAGAGVGGTEWVWNPISGMRCRDGSSTGFGLRRSPPDASAYAKRRLLIYLDSGGACYGAGRCINSGPGYDAASFAATVADYGTTGLFDERAENPFQDWNAILVPYCTGDIHSGDTTDVVIPDTVALGPQQFVGYRNVRTLLGLIQGQAAQASQVALVGASGGGFGAVGTYGLVAERLAPAPVYLINDSGQVPPDDEVLTDSLQLLWRELWNLETAAPDGCGERCFQPSGDGFEYAMAYYAATYPDRGFALISYMSDGPSRFHFSHLNPNCVVNPRGRCLVPADDFSASLLTIRDAFTELPNAVTYYTEGRGHFSINQDAFYERSTAGVPLNEWVRGVLNDTATDVGPAPSD